MIIFMYFLVLIDINLQTSGPEYLAVRAHTGAAAGAGVGAGLAGAGSALAAGAGAGAASASDTIS
jgi:hypothetical protein